MPMLVRSSAEKRDRTRLLRSMNVWRREAPVQGLRGSLLDARRPLRSAQLAVEFTAVFNEQALG